MEQLEFIENMKRLGYKKGFDLDFDVLDYKILEYLRRNLENICLNEKITKERMKNLTISEITKYFEFRNVMTTESFPEIVPKEISPYEIPVFYKEGDSQNGYLESVFVLDKEYKTLEKINNLFFKIILGRDLDLLSVGTYAHELMHTQVSSIYGYTDDFGNREVLSIFLELLVSLSLDNTRKLLKQKLIIRCADLESSLTGFITDLLMSDEGGLYSSDKIIEASCYVTSTYKALVLFDKYLSFIHDNKRRKMIYTIQDIIDGKIQLEELLAKYNVDDIYQEKKLKVIKKLLKK